VLAKVLRCNPRIIRRHIRHHRFDRTDSCYGPMVTMRNASGRLCYLLTRLQFQQFIFFEEGPQAWELQEDFCNTLGGLMDGTIPFAQCRDNDRASELRRILGRVRDILAASACRISKDDLLRRPRAGRPVMQPNITVRWHPTS
jgi:hypothetical protein